MKSGTAICLSIANASIAVMVLFADPGFGLMRLLVAVSFCIYLALLWLKKNYFLYLARTLFLGFIGYFPIGVKMVLGPDSLFSMYEAGTQGMKLAILMYGGTSLALLGNEIGLRFGHRRHFRVNKKVLIRSARGGWQLIFLWSIPVVIVTSALVAYANGPLVFLSGYHGSENTLPLGIVANIGVFCLLLAYAAISKTSIKHGKLIVICLALLLLVWAMLLRGDRNEVLSAMIGFLVIYSLTRRKPIRLSKRKLLFGLTLLVLLDLYGSVRSLDFLRLTPSMIVEVVANERISSEAVKFGTVSAVASTFSNSVWLVESGTMDFKWGLTYLEFIPRSLPSFVYPDRPKDYALMFEDYALRTGGGFFELGEAYLNLGLFGCFLFPLFFSFVIARTYSYVSNTQTVAGYFLIAALLSVFVRATWYQTFALYRSFTMVGFLLVIFLALYHLLIPKNQPETVKR